MLITERRRRKRLALQSRAANLARPQTGDKMKSIPIAQFVDGVRSSIYPSPNEFRQLGEADYRQNYSQSNREGKAFNTVKIATLMNR